MVAFQMSLEHAMAEAIDTFVQAMALKYDNDARVEAIEIPSGAGGEALPWTHSNPLEKQEYTAEWCPDGNCNPDYCPTHDENIGMCWAYDNMNWLIDTYADNCQIFRLILPLFPPFFGYNTHFYGIQQRL